VELIQSIRPEGYFSHFTAMQLHGLTTQVPKTSYLNFEQRATGGEGALSQQAIDRAFRQKCRVTTNMVNFQDHRICILNGRNTRQSGVIEWTTNDGANVRVTDIERTLIDATVRPIYSGGVQEVAKAFEAARDQVQISRLAAMLRKLKFLYPYHQAIGYYLERAGEYRTAQLDLLRSFKMEFDFYLTHAMKETQYVKAWRLFVPKGF
jgi:predicted transcriptional regulator of viral defense system